MVIVTALAKDPTARFASGATMTAAIAEALNVPVPESLGQPAYPPDIQNMPTYLSSPPSHVGAGMTPSSTPSFATSSPSASPLPSGSPPIHSVTPAYSTPQPATPTSWQQHAVSSPSAPPPVASPPRTPTSTHNATIKRPATFAPTVPP